MDDKILVTHLEETIEEVSNLVWGDADKTYILCTLKLSGGSELPFSAHSNDVEGHGRLLYEQISSGKYGKIAKFKAPKVEAEEQASPLEKLKKFLAANPDVKELLK